MCKHRTMAVTKVQTPDLHVSVRRSSGYQCTILKHDENNQECTQNKHSYTFDNFPRYSTHTVVIVDTSENHPHYSVDRMRVQSRFQLLCIRNIFTTHNCRQIVFKLWQNEHFSIFIVYIYIYILLIVSKCPMRSPLEVMYDHSHIILPQMQ